jgi:hypothetical protein
MDNDRDILLIAILTCITVAAWIFFEFVKTARTSTISPNTTKLVKPLKPTIDTDTLMTIQERTVYRNP